MDTIVHQFFQHSFGQIFYKYQLLLINSRTFFVIDHFDTIIINLKKNSVRLFLNLGEK